MDIRSDHGAYALMLGEGMQCHMYDVFDPLPPLGERPGDEVAGVF